MRFSSLMRTAGFGALCLLIQLAACSSGQSTAPSSASTVASSASSSSSPAKTDPPSVKGEPNAAPAKKVEVAGEAAPTTGPALAQAADAPKKLDTFVVARPPFAYTLRRAVPVETSPAPKLSKASEKKNAITDEVAWFQKNGLQLAGRMPSAGAPTLPAPLGSAPAAIGADRLHHILDHGDHSILMYGADYASMRVLMVLDGARKPKAVFDFNSFVKPPDVVPGDEPFVNAEVAWAVEKDNVLYVSTSHHTYAKSSKGKNAFVSAIDSKTGELLWQSDPLVCNSRNFVIHGGYILCAYGFTDEPDFLYVVSRADGKTISKTPMPSGASFLVMKDGKLFVRSYDTDFVFNVK